jgi:hypothetical protein
MSISYVVKFKKSMAARRQYRFGSQLQVLFYLFLFFKNLFMETRQLTLINTVAYYDPLLQRYARRVIENEEAAAVIVQDVLEAQFQINRLVPAKHLRQVLKTDVLNRCFFWLQSQIFDLSGPKISISDVIKLTADNEDNPLLN